MSTDWKSLKTEYIHAPQLTLKQLAKQCGVPYSALAAQSAKEGWFREKQRCRQQAADAAKQAVSAAVASAPKPAQTPEPIRTQPPAPPRTPAFAQQRKINEIANKLLENIALSSEYTEKPTSIYNLTTALKNVTAVLRDVNDLPNIKEERSYELTKRKLELAQSKLERREGAAQSGGVVVLPEVAAADGAE
ncbi:MAG: hypothetical protein IJJ41_05790 [Clostridia bacterium]|nr:hypothetical protein [Clostridia bacterium]